MTRSLHFHINLMILMFQSLLSLAPKKPNWDLKKEIEKKMDRLDQLTQRALIELASSFFSSQLPSHPAQRNKLKPRSIEKRAIML